MRRLWKPPIQYLSGRRAHHTPQTTGKRCRLGCMVRHLITILTANYGVAVGAVPPTPLSNFAIVCKSLLA